MHWQELFRAIATFMIISMAISEHMSHVKIHPELSRRGSAFINFFVVCLVLRLLWDYK